MSPERGPSVPGPDDFDRQLRDLTSGSAGAARYREPSAEERAKQAAQRKPRQRAGWRGSAKARQRRGPVDPPRQGSRGPLRRRRLRLVGGNGARRPAPGARRAKLLSIAKMVAILVGFIALLIVLHLLGLGPQ
jgi:hypothetical protein